MRILRRTRRLHEAPRGGMGLGCVRTACGLQSPDARRFPVVHDKGVVVKLRDAGVELAQKLEHEGLVGLPLPLVVPAVLAARVELVIRRAKLANLVVESLRSRVVVDYRDARSSLTVVELVLLRWTGKEVERDLESLHHCTFLLFNG